MIRFLRRLLGCRCEERKAQVEWMIDRQRILEDKIFELTRPVITTKRGCHAPTYEGNYSTLVYHLQHQTAEGVVIIPVEVEDPTVTDLAAHDEPAAQPVRRGRPRKAVPSTPRQRRVKADSIAPAENAHWKVCTRCGGEAKPIADFYPASNGKGFRPECKDCTKRQVKEASARKQREQSQPVKRDLRTDLETQEVYTHPPAPVGTDKERDAAVSKTADAKAAIKALCLGDTVTVQKSNGESLTGICKGRNDACFYIAGDWGSESYTVSDILLGDAMIVRVIHAEEAAVG